MLKALYPKIITLSECYFLTCPLIRAVSTLMLVFRLNPLQDFTLALPISKSFEKGGI